MIVELTTVDSRRIKLFPNGTRDGSYTFSTSSSKQKIIFVGGIVLVFSLTCSLRAIKIRTNSFSNSVSWRFEGNSQDSLRNVSHYLIVCWIVCLSKFVDKSFLFNLFWINTGRTYFLLFVELFSEIFGNIHKILIYPIQDYFLLLNWWLCSIELEDVYY